MRSSRFKFLPLVPFVMYVGLFRNLPTVFAAPEMIKINNDNRIEHQVTAEEAKKAVKDIEPDKMIGAGCKSCSRSEIEYCLSSDVISDHCCCERKFKERFPYMEHTCPLDDDPCQTMRRDCSDYTRIVDCCCDQQLASKWKANYLKSCASRTNAIPIFDSIRASFSLLMAYLDVIVK